MTAARALLHVEPSARAKALRLLPAPFVGAARHMDGMPRLEALALEIEDTIFKPVASASTLRAANEKIDELLPTFSRHWAEIARALTGATRGNRDLAAGLLDAAATRPQPWASPGARRRVGAMTQQFLRAAYDARLRTARLLLSADPRLAPAMEPEIVDRWVRLTIATDFALWFCAWFVTSPRRRAPKGLPRALAETACSTARAAYGVLAAPLYADADERHAS